MNEQIDGRKNDMSMSDELYECANRKCRHVYRNDEAVWVPEQKPGPKTLPTFRGTCPKCGSKTFYLAKNRKTATQKPIRTCYSMHECCICGQTISLGQRYRDGGYGKRSHEQCTPTPTPRTVGKR